MRPKWTWVALAELVEFVSGGTPQKSNNAFWNGTIPWISAKNMKTERVSDSSLYITPAGLRSGSVMAPKGTILLLTRGSELFNRIPICYVDSNVAFNQDVKCLMPKSGTNMLFVFYWLLSQVSFLKQKVESTGIGAGKFDTQILKELQVLLPPDDIQREIVQAADSLSQRIHNNTKINHHLEQIAQAIFKSWFVDFDAYDGEIPGDWQSTTLGNLCEIVTKGTTPTTLKKQFVAQGINFVKAESILDDHSFDFGKLAFIDDDTHALLSRSVLREADIIFTIAGTLGRFAFVGADLLPANTNQAVAIIRTDTSKIKPVTLYSFFIGGLHSDFYTKNIQQAVQANLSLATIKALPLLMPPTETLNEYAALIEPLFQQIFQNYAESRRLAALRDTLLPRLMSGELSNAE